MAFPSIVSENSGTQPTADIFHTVDLPSGLVQGNLLVLIFSCRPTSVFTPLDWDIFGNSSASNTTLRSYSRIIDGTEGSTLTVQTVDAFKSCHRVVQFSGHDVLNLPEATETFSDVDDLNPDSPAITPTGGSKEYYIISAHGQRDVGPTTDFPTSYSNTGQVSVPASGSFHLAWADREVTASTENPSAFTTTSAHDWSSITIAIHPEAVDQASPEFISSGSTLHEPSLNLDQTASIDFISSGSGLFEPSLANQGELELDFISSGTALHEPSLLQSEAANSWFNGDWYRSPFFGTGWFGEAALVTTVDFISSGTQTHEPTLNATISTEIDFISSQTTIHEPSLFVDGVANPDYISSTTQLHEPSVALVLDQALAVPFIISSYIIEEPTLTLGKKTTIDGAASYVIDVNYRSVTLYFNPSSGWFTID